MTFDAFISYSHAADGRLAPAVQRAIQRLAKPWYRARALRVFRDESALSANPHLWSSIQAALDDAEWFVLLASPDAVASAWVGRELTHWLSAKSADRILVVVTDGAWEWDANTRALTGTAVPEALRNAFVEEPRHVDLRWAATETDLDMHHARFRDVIAQLAAPMHGIAKDDLDSEDVRQHRRARRLARGGVTVLTLLVVISLVFGTIAAAERNSARSQRSRADDNAAEARSESRIANGERLSALAEVRSSSRLDQALLLAVEGYRHADTLETRSGLVSVLAGASGLEHFRHLWTGDMVSASASRDGSTIATADAQSRVRVWNARTGHELWSTGFAEGFVETAVSSDGRLVVVSANLPDGGQDIRAFDGASGHQLGKTIRKDVDVEALSISPDEKTLVLAGVPRTASGPLPVGIRIVRFALPDLSQAGQTMLVSGLIDSGLAFTPDSRVAIVPFETGVWFVDLASSAAPTSVAAPFAAREVAAVSPNGRELAIGDASGAIERYDLATRSPLGASTRDDSSAVESLRFDDHSSKLVSARDDGAVTVQNARNGKPLLPPFVGQSGRALVATFAGNGVESVGTSEVTDWTLAPQAPLGKVEPGPPPADPTQALGQDLAMVGPDTVAISTEDGVVRFRDARTGLEVSAPLRSGQNQGSDIAVSRDGQRIVQDTDDATGVYPHNNVSNVRFVVWDRARGIKIADLPVSGQGSVDVAMSPDGRLLADATIDAVEVINVATGKDAFAPLRVSRSASPAVSVAFTPDGKDIATGGEEGRVEIWNASTGKSERTFDSEGSTIVALAVSNDGKRLAAATQNGAVVVRDLATGRSVGDTLAIGGAAPTHLAFDDSGDLLAVGASDGTVSVWDLRSHSLIGRPLQAHSARVNGLAFADHDRVLVSGSGDGSVAFDSLDPNTWIQRACAIVGRNLTRAEWHQYIGGAYQRTCPQWPAGS